MAKKGMTYKSSGLDYDPVDRFKRLAGSSARETAGNLRLHGFEEVPGTRGESAYLFRRAFRRGETLTLGHVEEGLGTKNLVADIFRRQNEKRRHSLKLAEKMLSLTSRSYYENVAQDTVAMIVNDMITLGCLPLTIAMHLAVGNSKWFNDEARCRDLIAGWQKACNLSGAAWAGGETPVLIKIIYRQAALLSGSSVGYVPEGSVLSGNRIRNGSQIVLIDGNGLHANGYTLARQIADILPKGYLTKLPDGRTYGESLLDPTPIYVPAIAECQKQGIDIQYAVNITGHGWRKLMRAEGDRVYVIKQLPKPKPIHDFIQKKGRIDLKEMYGTFNMGPGFAIFVDKDDVAKAISAIGKAGLSAIHAGFVVGTLGGQSQVVIQPLKNMIFKAEELNIR